MLDQYSRRYPYFWNRPETKEIISDLFKEVALKYCKQEYDEQTMSKHSLYYYNVACALDIEDSSFYQQDYLMSDPYKVSVMYVWQFGIDNVVIMGRTWDDFMELLDTIKRYVDDHNRIIIYVHFLDHEFQFMRKWLKWDRVFSRKVRSPIYAITGGIEFRDSYILSGKSLAATAKDIRTNRGLKKRIGDLDYSLIRSSHTHLSRKEIGYCMADVQILNTYINEKIADENDNIGRIPLTNTGYVRRYVRKECLPTKRSRSSERWCYYNGIHDLNISHKEYRMLKRAFQGGFTHANVMQVGEDIKERVDSIDFTSSYPAVLLSMEYPASSGEEVKIHSKEEFKRYMSEYLCIFTIKYTNIREKSGVFDNIISYSKCWDVTRPVLNNGRICQAITLTTCITNVDFESISKFYDYASYQIGTMYIYKKGYMPKPVIRSILEFYKAKTKLKGIKGAELEYLLKKGMLNSVYGMMVTDIVKPLIRYEDDWIGEEYQDLDESLTKYNDNRQRFLYYPWGVYVTAYARRNLFSGILEFGKDYIYSDTDSIKCFNIGDHMDYIKRYNQWVTDQIDHVLIHYGIDPEESRPANSEGHVKQIGIWDWETESDPYTEFKTLGAKRYMYRQSDGIHITIAGVSKRMGRDFIASQNDPFNFFGDDMTIPAEYSGKLTHTYIDDERSGMAYDYKGQKFKYFEKSAVHLEKTAYKMSLMDDFEDFCKKKKKGVEILLG